jgi:hypothetical protein
VLSLNNANEPAGSSASMAELRQQLY